MARQMTIADQLKKAIRESGKTEYRIAKDAGIGPEQVGRFLAGSDIRISTAAKVCLALGFELCKSKTARKEGAK